MIEAIIAIVSLAMGGGVAWMIASKNTSTKAIETEAKAESLLATAQSKADAIRSKAES